VPQQGSRAALADCFGVPVQPYLGQECGEVGHRTAVDLVIKIEQVPLGGRVTGKAADQSLVQRLLGLLVVRDLLGVLPPCLQSAVREQILLQLPPGP
jgi:hypothetical protein